MLIIHFYYSAGGFAVGIYIFSFERYVQKI